MIEKRKNIDRNGYTLEGIGKSRFNSHFWFLLNAVYQTGTKESIFLLTEVGKATIKG